MTEQIQEPVSAGRPRDPRLDRSILAATRDLLGEVGYTKTTISAIARRSGDTWYIGAMTDWTPRELELDLSFIGNGNYDIESFADGINADRAARDFRKTVSELPQDRRLKIRMAPGGGYAARIYAR